MLVFSEANSKLIKLQKKLGKKIYSLDLLSGWSCPFAKECKSKVVGNINGLRILDGPQCKYRCYSASQEVIYRKVFLKRLKNFQVIKSYANSITRLSQLINQGLPSDCEVLRWHVSGDFFCKNYMRAAMIVAINNPGIEFYGYTKAIRYYNELWSIRPKNFRLIASLGGTQDVAIKPFMKTSRVVYSRSEAKQLGLSIDTNDFLSFQNKKDFALLIHGVQPKKIIEKEICV